VEDSLRLFKALSDKSRLRIVLALMRSGKELCICELVDTLKLAQYNISRHVKELKTAGLVQERKAGKFVMYSLVKHSDGIRKCAMKTIAKIQHELIDDDARRLENRLSLRKDNKCVVGVRKSVC